MEELGCVYYIYCTETSKGYVGLHSKPTPDSRIKKHWRANDNYLLHNAMRKYGKDAFEVMTLCLVPISSLPNMESYWAEQLETYMWDSPGGYNMSWCGDKPRTGILSSEETRRKISEATKGRKVSDETRAKMSEAQKGNTKGTACKGIKKPPISEETRAKLSESRKGYKHTEETRAKIGLSKLGNTNNLGKTTSEETKEKLRIKAIGRIHTEETKEKMRNRVIAEETKEKLREISTGKKHTEESKEKNRQASTGRLHSEETKQKMRDTWARKRGELTNG